MKIRVLFFALISIILSGCTSCFINVDVDSISSPIAKQKSKYILLPGNKDCKNSDLQFIEFAAYTNKALQAAGFVEASNLDEADVAILLSYGISDPHVYEYNYSVPIWGQTGISSSNSYGTVSTFGNTAIYSNKTSYTPTYGIVGSSTQTGVGVLFARYLAISGFDLEKFKKTNKIEDAEELWSTKAKSVGECGDLRKIFPILLIASQNHIASSTGEKIRYSLKADDERIQKLKGTAD